MLSRDIDNTPIIKVLFLAANPDNTPLLKVDEEIRQITAGIRSAEYRNSLELISAWAVRPDDVIQALNSHKQRTTLYIQKSRI
jgi:hypothetical protein